MIWLVLAFASPAFDACDAEGDEAKATRCIYMEARKNGDFDGARSRLEAREGPWALVNLANVLAAVGDREAAAAYRRAEVAFDGGDPAGLVTSALGLRILEDRAGQHDAAEASLSRARAAAGTHAMLVARVDAEAARAAHRRGEQERAVALARKADVPGVDYQTRLVVLHVLAGALLELGRVEASWSYSERLIEHTAQANDAYAEASCRMNAYWVATDHPRLLDVEWLTLATQARDVAERGGNPFVLAGANCEIAHITADRAGLEQCLQAGVQLDDPVIEVQALRGLAQVDAPDAALGHLDKAERIARGVGIRFTVAQVQNDRAALLWTAGRREESDVAAEAAVRTVEAIRDTHGQDLARAGFTTVWRAAWEFPAARWLAAGDIEKAWAWSEAMRARELLAERHGVGAPAVDDLLDSLWDDLTPEERSARLAEIARREDAARVSVHTSSLHEVQSRLAPGEALVSYVFPTQVSLEPWAWWVTRDDVQWVPLELEGVSDAVRTVMSMENPPEATLSLLRERLWAPLPRSSAIERLVVVPDGLLHQLPLGVLAPELPMTVATSATLWAEASSGEAGLREVRSLVDPAGAALPASVGEGERWVSLFGGVLLSGPDAVRGALVGMEDVLHIATHGVVDPTNGALGVHLADGMLSSKDIAALELDRKVIILSVCEGNAGPVFEAEGAMSLTRAFLQAGARAVVSSGVPLRDAEAARVFGGLADRWATGVRLDEAVAQLRQEQPDGPAWTVEIHGDGSATLAAVPRTGTGARLWGAALGLFVGLGGAALLLRTRWSLKRTA